MTPPTFPLSEHLNCYSVDPDRARLAGLDLHPVWVMCADHPVRDIDGADRGGLVSVSDLAIVAVLVFAWGTLSARLERSDVTGPIIFVTAGLVLAHGPLAVLSVQPSHELIKQMAEFTLALVLFSDASRVGWQGMRADAGLYLRLLGGALPVTIVLGTLLALVLVSPGDVWLALLAAATLAPTDAALGAGMMTNPSVPGRIRRLLNVESGLNDGIATPVVLIALAGAGDVAVGHGVDGAVGALALGLLVGTAVGAAGGLLVKVTGRRGWAASGFAGTAVLGLAVCAYASAVAVGGNGFIAAFTAGLAFGTASGRHGQPLVPFVEEIGALVSLLVWLAFGAVEVVPALQGLTWQIGLYAVLSLTVIRMLPVAVALIGTGLGRADVAVVGWFGPRGLASVVFALLALEELGRRHSEPAISAITITVLLSVVAHGATADPIARMYANRPHPDAAVPEPPGSERADIPERRLIRRARKT